MLVTSGLMPPPRRSRLARDLLAPPRGELVGAGGAALQPAPAPERDGGGVFAVSNRRGRGLVRRADERGGEFVEIAGTLDA